MRTQTLAISAPINLGVDILKIYRRCSYSVNHWEKPPSFEELYERFVEELFEKRTNMPQTEIDLNLRTLRDEHSEEVFDIERGFRPTAYGAPTEAQLFNALLVYCLCFEFKGQIYNNPIVGVW